MIVRTKDETTLFKEVCEIAVEYGKFKMAWIGMINPESKRVVSVMHAGDDSGYLSKLKAITAADKDQGKGPTGTAIRERRTEFCNDIENDDRMKPWKDAAISRGYYSSIAIPIKKAGNVIGAFTLYAGEKNFFDSEEIKLLEEASRDISFALDFFEKENLRNIAELKVLEREQSYHTLTEISPLGIFRTDAEGLSTYVNPRWCEISGLSAVDALGNGWLSAVHADDKKAMLEGWDDAVGKKVHSLSEYRFVRPDGSIAWVYGQATPEKNLAGQVIGYVGNITDITERKKAEEAILLSNERYNLVGKATNDSLWDLNILTGIITRTGDGFKTLFGYEDAQIDNDEKFNSLIHPEDLAEVGALLQETFDDPTKFYWEQEYRILKADGNYASVYDKGYIIRDKAGKAIRMIGAMQDITKLKENESHLKKLNESLLEQAVKLTDSNDELERFAYVASHDMQEPLRMVTSFLVLLEKRYQHLIDENGKKYIHFAVDGAKRMRQIILDLLEFSRIGQDFIEPKLLNLNALISEIELLYCKQIEEKKATIEVEKLPSINSFESPVRQVFQNLISNALKYSLNHKPVRIKIGVTEAGNWWQFSVSDNGIGISKEYFDKIFIIFKRLHTRDQYSGTGIGLSVTKKIINKQGGKIWVESKEGEGTTFYFTLKK
jgi:PAS domain S-box-containing protein